MLDGSNAETEEVRFEPDFRQPRTRINTGLSVTLSKQYRQSAELGGGRLLHIALVNDEYAFTALRQTLRSPGKIHIPKKAQRVYGVEHGDTADLYVQATDLTAP